MRKFCAAAIAGLSLTACNPIAEIDVAGDEIERFHNLYNAGDYDAIYAAASPGLREAATRAQWSAMLTHVHERLGAVEDFTQTGFDISTSNGVTTTSITLTTTYEGGEGAEFFTFYDEGDGMLLNGWELESDTLRGPSPAPAGEAKPGKDAGAETVPDKPST